jgi:hypothetical protein
MILFPIPLQQSTAHNHQGYGENTFDFVWDGVYQKKKILRGELKKQ